MKNELKDIVKNFSGKVISIGLYEELCDIIEKNDKVLFYDILDNKTEKKGKIKFFGNKSININKIRKRYKKKKIDYIICDYEIIKPYIKKFVKNSVYINKNKLYFYGDVDIDLITKKYGRYDTKINIKKYKNTFIVEIDNTKSKNKRIKEIFYSIKDNVEAFIDIAGDILMG